MGIVTMRILSVGYCPTWDFVLWGDIVLLGILSYGEYSPGGLCPDIGKLVPVR